MEFNESEVGCLIAGASISHSRSSPSTASPLNNNAHLALSSTLSKSSSGRFLWIEVPVWHILSGKGKPNYQVYASSWMPVYKAIIGVGCHVYESVQGTSKHNLQLFQNILSSSDFLFSSELNMCLLLSKCCHLSVPSLLLRDYPFGFLKQNPGTAESTISLCLK